MHAKYLFLVAKQETQVAGTKQYHIHGRLKRCEYKNLTLYDPAITPITIITIRANYTLWTIRTIHTARVNRTIRATLAI